MSRIMLQLTNIFDMAPKLQNTTYMPRSPKIIWKNSIKYKMTLWKCGSSNWKGKHTEWNQEVVFFIYPFQ